MALADFSQAIKVDPNVAFFHLQRALRTGCSSGTPRPSRNGKPRFSSAQNMAQPTARSDGFRRRVRTRRAKRGSCGLCVANC